MSGRPLRVQRRLYSALIFFSIFGLLFAAEALGALAPPVPRETASPVATVTAEQLSAIPGNRDLRDILSIHNRLRSEVGARPLRWNTALAANAQRYANVLAETGQVVHASRVGRENERENIVVGPLSGISPVRLTEIWVKEKAQFRPGTYPGVCVGDWSTCSHYTQMIWPGTTDIGCGYARGRFDALVCRYSPPGNKDGVALGPTMTRDQQLAEGLCTGPGGVVIECGNNDGEDGGVVEDGGGGDRDTGIKEEIACAVDVNVHRPISVDPEQTVIPEVKELERGATTLRNDDSDWPLGREGGTGRLPVITLPTDIERRNNPNENDLVKVVGLNPNNLPRVYLFAFPTQAEANRALGTQVQAVNTGRHANAQELGYFSAETKAAQVAALPRVVTAEGLTFWLEGMLGGKYRMVIGKLVDGINPGDVRYDPKTDSAYASKDRARVPAFVCEDQATVTVAVVDIYQERRSKRLTGFDVYWSGRPHFRAEVWPAGLKYSWGEKYRLGRDLRDMPGTAVHNEKVATMVRDAEDVRGDNNASLDGPTVMKTGSAGRGGAAKAQFEGGFQIHSLNENGVPTVNRDAGNRYPDRVSLEYEVNEEKLVRAEYLEVILPKVRPPAASMTMGSVTRVASSVQYSIVDMFDRPITAANISDYVGLYGAGLKAWEALEGQAGRVVEQGLHNDELVLTNTGVDNRGNARPPVPLGTAQRGQTTVREDRMTAGTFQDTLVFTAPTDADAREALWRASTGRATQQDLDRAVAEARARDDALNGRPDPNKRYRNAQERQDDIDARRNAVPDADQARITRSNILSIPQDVILQLRVGSDRKDLMVFQGNRLTVYAPYFFNQNKYLGDKDSPVFRFHLRFEPGSETSRIVPVNHRRPR